MVGDLYTLKFKQGYGIQTVFLQASSLAKAIQVGQRYCDGIINCRFIKVEQAVVADESILNDEPRAPAHKFDEPARGTDENPNVLKPPQTTRSREAVKEAVAAIPPLNPALEKARDAADEDEDRKQQLLDEQREAEADRAARGNKTDGSASADGPKELVGVAAGKLPALPKVKSKK